MKLALIVAFDQNFGIGKDNDLMWHLPHDMAFFKETTKDQIVVMGRKNFESIPPKFRPLPHRENVIITRNKEFHTPSCLVFNDLQKAISHFQNDPRTLFIIGGGEIYSLAMKTLVLDTLYITKVHHVFDADTFFPSFDESQWKITTLFEQPIDEKHSHGFTVYRYTK